MVIYLYNLRLMQRANIKLGIAAVASIAIGFLLGANLPEKTIKVDYPSELSGLAGSSKFLCETLLANDISAIKPNGYRKDAGITGTLGGHKGEKVVIEVKNGKLNIITNTDVEFGQTTPSSLNITTNDDTTLIASAGLSTFALYKSNGLGVWSETALTTDAQPIGGTSFLGCRPGF